MISAADKLSKEPRPFLTLQGKMTFDELFGGISILACINGLWGRVLIASRADGWLGVFVHTDISLIVVICCVLGAFLILANGSGELQRIDRIVAAIFVLLVMLPIFALSWLVVCGLSIYVLLRARDASERKRGALILLAVTLPMLWVPLIIQFFERELLFADTALVAWVTGTRQVGDLVHFVKGAGFIQVAPGCSSVTNVSLALLCWVGVTQWANHRFVAQDIFWCFLASFSAVMVNVVRMAAMAHSPQFYEFLHNQHWDLTANIASSLTLALSIAFSLLGVRHEIFSKA